MPPSPAGANGKFLPTQVGPLRKFRTPLEEISNIGRFHLSAECRALTAYEPTVSGDGACARKHALKALIITDNAAGRASCETKFAAQFAPLICTELRRLPETLRRWPGAEPELVVLDILRSPTKCLAVVPRVRAVFPHAKVVVQQQTEPSNFDYLALQVGAHGVADFRNTEPADIKVMLAAVLGGSITRR